MSLMSEDDIKDCLQDILPVLNASNFEWWLGRGLLRHYYLNGQIGDKQSDLDIHVWFSDKEKVISGINGSLSEKGYTLVEESDRPYKFTFEDEKNNKFIEFIMLYPTKGGVIHKRKEGPKGPHPKSCFAGYDKFNIAGYDVKIPDNVELYLNTTYPEWKSNDKSKK